MFPFYLADLPPPAGETTNFDYCVSLNNLTKHSDYLVVAQVFYPNRSRDISPYWVMTSETCLPLEGRRPQVNLFAVPKAQITKSDLVQLNPDMQGMKAPDGRLLRIWYTGTALKSFEIVESKGIPASDTIKRPFSVPFWDGNQTVVDRYTITTLTENSFTIKHAGRDGGLSGVQLLALPLLGIMLLFLVKNQKRFQRKTPKSSSEPID
jgi:hypothetical protein